MSLKSTLLKTADSLAGPAACALLSRPQRRAERRLLSGTEGSVLVIRPGGIGDAVMLLPMLCALRRAAPGRRVDILCESRNEAVFALALPGCAAVAYDRLPLTALSMLLRGRYACVLDSEQFHNFSGAMAALTRAPLRIGFKINTKRRGLYTHLVDYDLDGPEDAQFMRLLCAACGAAQPAPPRFGILREMLPGFGAGETRSGLAVHAGGSVQSKRCPAEVIGAAAARAAAKHSMPVVILGGKQDAGYAAAIGAEILRIHPGAELRNLCGAMDLAGTARACAAARALLGPDSGVAHLSVAAGTPAVALFGPSDPRKWAPPPGAGRAVRIDLPCSPCSVFGYTKPCVNHECVRGLSPERISEALDEILCA